MKVLLIAPEPFFAVRGTPMAILQLVKALGRFGHQVDIVTYHIGENVKVRNVVIHRIINLPFVRYVPIGPSYVKLVLDFFLFLKALGMCMGNHYDIIHAVEESVFLGLILKRIFHLPVIYDMDSRLSEQLSRFWPFNINFFSKIISFLEKQAIDKSTLVLTICSSMTNGICSSFPQKKVFQLEDIPVENGSQTVSQKEVLALKKRLGLSGRLVVLYAGNFEDYQGVDLLIRSIPQMAQAESNMRVILIGGESAQITMMKKLVSYLRVDSFVIFTGKMAPTMVSRYMALADILVSPRRKGTNTPLKIFTYLKSGKPLVATNLPTHTQVLDENISVLVNPNPEDIAQGVISLLRNRELRVKIGRQGKIFVEKNYNYDRFINKVGEIYEYVSVLINKNIRVSSPG